MSSQDIDFDYGRYRRMLADAVDEPTRLALIDTLIQDRAMDMLAAARASQRAEEATASITRVLYPTPR